MRGLVYIKVDMSKSNLMSIIKREYPYFIDNSFVLFTDIFVNFNENHILIGKWDEIYSEYSSLFSLSPHIMDADYVLNYIENDLRYFNFIKKIDNVIEFIREFEIYIEVIEEDKLGIIFEIIDKEIIKLEVLVSIISSINYQIFVSSNVSEKKIYIELFNSIIKYMENFKKEKVEIFI